MALAFVRQSECEMRLASLLKRALMYWLRLLLALELLEAAYCHSHIATISKVASR